MYLNLLEECGLVYYNSTAGSDNVAARHSRPATAYILFFYNAIITVNRSSFFTYYYFTCDGILVNRKTILTAASCAPKNYTWYERYNGNTYNVNVTLNPMFPELTSIYSVYVGLITPPFPDTDLASMQQVYVQDIVTVLVHNMTP